MINVGIAVGVGVGAFLVVCFLCWAACKLRQCIKTGRMLEEVLVEKRKGVRLDVVRTFPIVEPSELNCDENSKLQCPICWVQFGDADTIRQLPHCNHVFHADCIESVLESQVTCPVCGVILTGNPQNSEGCSILTNRRSNPPHFQEQISLRSLYSLDKETQKETHEETQDPADPAADPPASSHPSWMLVNRPKTHPRTETDHSSSSDRFEIELDESQAFRNTAGESPLLSRFFEGAESWQHVPDDDDLQFDQHCIDISFTFGSEVSVEKRQPRISHDRSVDSFSFAPSSVGALGALGALGAFRSSLRRSRGKESTSFSDVSTRFSRHSSISSSADSRFDKSDMWDSAREHLEEVAEGDGKENPPLTDPPDQCAFDVMPVVSTASLGREGNSPRVGSNRKVYSKLRWEPRPGV